MEAKPPLYTDKAGKPMTTHNTEIEVIHASMMHQSVDAVVNAANPNLANGGGITREIFDKAGQGLPAEIKQKYPKGTPTGTAVITGGYDLKQSYIIHTPGPDCHLGRGDDAEMLASSYRSCLEVAEANGLKSIAFCSISTGIYGFPLDKAAPLALATVRDYLDAHPDTTLERIVFAMYGEEEYNAFSKAYTEAAA